MGQRNQKRFGDFVSVEPFRGAVALTKSDVTTFDPTGGIYVGGDGDVAVKMESGETVTYRGMKAGTGIEISITMLLSTGTTATDVVGMYR
jgi:hypothetical protein